MARQLSSVLWDQAPHNTLRWAATIDQAVNLSPIGRSLLPEEFDSSNRRGATRQLRAAFDPLELDPAAWPAKLVKAEAHFQLEQTALAPRRQREGESFLGQARLLQAAGLSIKEIAGQLKVKEDTLRTALKRARRKARLIDGRP